MKNLFFIFPFCFLCFLSGYETFWLTPIQLSSPGVNASNPSIVIHPFTGSAVAVWKQEDGIYANTMTYILERGETVWGDAQKISLLGGVVRKPNIVMDSMGIATAVWIENSSLQLSTFSLSQGWSDPITLPYNINTNSELAVAIEPVHGTIGMIWGFNGTIQTVIKTSSMQDWPSFSQEISSVSGRFLKMVIGENGLVAAVWQASVHDMNIIYSTRKESLDSYWLQPEIISNPIEDCTNPNLAVDSQGNLHALWFRSNQKGASYTDVILQQRFYRGVWGGIVDVSQPGIYDPAYLKTDVFFNSFGVGGSLWTTSFDGSFFSLQGYGTNPGAYIIDFIAPDIYTYSFSTAINPIGYAFGVYMISDTEERSVILSQELSTLSSSIFLRGPYLVSSPSIEINANPRVAAAFVMPNHLCVAVWEGFDGENKVIFANSGQHLTLPPPTNPQVVKGINNKQLFIEYYNYITWEPSVSPDIVSYEILRNGLPIASLSPSTTEFRDGNRLPESQDQYLIFAKSSDGDVSVPAEITENFCP